jgi:Response regulator of the LytR/AlgR family
MRIAICEDTKKDALYLQKTAERYLSENHLSAEFALFESGEAFLAAAAPGKYQIVFMDIFMAKKGLNGMETAKRLKAMDDDVAVIFTTATTEYGIEGYNVSVYYIVKPVQYNDLVNAMKKCRHLIDRYAAYIEITVNRRPIRVRLREIYCVEALQRNCVFTTEMGELATARSFEGLEQELGGLPFLQCHRSYIVNLNHVEKLENRDFILKNGRMVPVSKHVLPEIRAVFRQFLRTEMRELETGM